MGLSRYNYVKQYIHKTGGAAMKNKLIIKKKALKGEDGYKVFSVRLKDETVEKLNDLAQKSNRTRNELINILLDYAMKECEIEED